MSSLKNDKGKRKYSKLISLKNINDLRKLENDKDSDLLES